MDGQRENLARIFLLLEAAGLTGLKDGKTGEFPCPLCGGTATAGYLGSHGIQAWCPRCCLIVAGCGNSRKA